jgi:polyphosphate kinase 2 (PPK2 family)
MVEGALTYELYPPGTLSLEAVDLSQKVDDQTYEKELPRLQERAFALQVRNYLEGGRAIVGFEGWDAAGKGGCIRRLTTLMDPRGYKVWPIGPPGEEERRHHWLWRFWQRLPERGDIAIFDRTWYGRVLVERVDELTEPSAWRRAYAEINAFERMLTADGQRLVKIFLHVDRVTQKKRFEERATDPVKRYKLSEADWRNRKKWKAYAQAYQEMFDRTHRPDAPWVIVPSNDKKFARLEVLRTVIRLLEGSG